MITEYSGKPIGDTINFWEGFYPAYTDLNRRDTALHYMTQGYLLSDTVQIKGIHDGKFEECHFDAILMQDAKPNTNESNLQITAKSLPSRVCESIRVRKRDIKSDVPIDTPNFEQIHNPTFKIGVSDSTGYLYIPAFGAYGYRETCEDEWSKFQRTFSGECADECLWEFKYHRMYQRLTDDLELAIENLNTKNISKLVIDVTNNGGGSDWVDLVARVVAPKPLNCQKVSLLKSDNSLQNFKEVQKSIKSDLKGDFGKQTKDILRQALSNVNRLISEFPSTCDRQSYWTRKDFKPSCNILTENAHYACGFLPYVKPGLLDGVARNQPIFKSSDFSYRESLFQGELAILVNRNTSSSAEQLVSMLKDNIDSVRIIGEHTNSTGCGYYSGGNPIELKQSGLIVNMSNCVRYQASGKNEVFGIQPDVDIIWQEEDSFTLGSIFQTPSEG